MRSVSLLTQTYPARPFDRMMHHEGLVPGRLWVPVQRRIKTIAAAIQPKRANGVGCPNSTGLSCNGEIELPTEAWSCLVGVLPTGLPPNKALTSASSLEVIRDIIKLMYHGTQDKIFKGIITTQLGLEIKAKKLKAASTRQAVGAHAQTLRTT